jgi:hypothetical protein
MWCQRRGLNRVRSLTVVLFANAWGESRMRPDAIGDGGEAFGLFQANLGGLGGEWVSNGGTTEQLLNPYVNTRLILWEAARQRPFLDALDSGTVADAVRTFVYYVERPSDKAGDSRERIEFARYFASGADPYKLPCSQYR